MATLTCQNCGAPWQPDVTGACRYCGVAAPPPGVAPGVIGARPVVDPDALCRLLVARTTDPDRPLDRLAAALRDVAGDRVTTKGSPVNRIDVSLDDWQYQAWTEHGDVAARAVHMVRGVVLKHQPLPFDEWTAAVSGHLAELAGTHPHVYQAIVALGRA